MRNLGDPSLTFLINFYFLLQIYCRCRWGTVSSGAQWWGMFSFHLMEWTSKSSTMLRGEKLAVDDCYCRSIFSSGWRRKGRREGHLMSVKTMISDSLDVWIGNVLWFELTADIRSLNLRLGQKAECCIVIWCIHSFWNCNGKYILSMSKFLTNLLLKTLSLLFKKKKKKELGALTSTSVKILCCYDILRYCAAKHVQTYKFWVL